MKALVLTHVGLEDVSADEIKSLIGAKNVNASNGKIFFECDSHQDLIRLCYWGRTFSKVILLLSSSKLDGMPSADLLENLEEFLGKTAAITCERNGEHDFTSFDVQRELNSALEKKYGVTIKHKNPQTTFFLLVDYDDCHFGVDFSGVDLGRRDYRIFLGTNSLKGTIAAGLLVISDFKPEHSLLDPFCRHGIIPIEAALLSTNMSPHKFNKDKFGFCGLPNLKYELEDNPKEFSGTIIAMDDNFKHVSASKKNAKIAGVIKSINFTRTDLEWLDLKFGKNFIDRIITFPVQLSKTNESKFDKICHEFFNQADFILKKDGKACLVMRRGVDVVKEKAAEFKFKLERERKVMQGSEELTVLVFSK